MIQNNVRGISLIENLVALAILLIGVMGFTVSFTRSLMHSTAARNDSQALYVATSFLEELKSLPFDDWMEQSQIDALEQEFLTNFYGKRDKIDGYYTVNAESETEVTDVTGDEAEVTARLVTITVSWVGDLDEQGRLGFGGNKLVDGSNHAFVVEGIVSKTVSDALYGGVTE